jgi:long-chain-fatty-acid---luciferin-component ligase
MTWKSKLLASSLQTENIDVNRPPQNPLGNAKLEALCNSWSEVPSPDKWDPVEKALYTTNQFSLDEEMATEIRLEAVSHSIKYHYEHNTFYRRLCEISGVKPDDLNSPDVLHKTPLVPEHIFKGCPGPDEFVQWLAGISSDEVNLPNPGDLQGSYDEQISILRRDYDITVRTTSGSSGIPSFLPRDSTTTRRSDHWKIITYGAMHPKFLSVNDLLSVSMWPLYFSWANLITSQEHVHKLLDSNLGFETVISAMNRRRPEGIVDRLLGRKNMNHSGRELLESFVNKLSELLDTGLPGIIWSPPFLIYTLVAFVKENNIRLELGPNWKIELGGGWKLIDERPLSEEELRTLVSQTLGIPPENIYDKYGSTECLDLCALSCEGGYKHIPHSVLHPLVLNEDMEPADDGAWGRFGFLNPLIRSYPGFVITGDRVRMHKRCPACERRGPVLDSLISRMPDAEDRGCANIVREIITERLGA